MWSNGRGLDIEKKGRHESYNMININGLNINGEY